MELDGSKAQIIQDTRQIELIDIDKKQSLSNTIKGSFYQNNRSRIEEFTKNDEVNYSVEFQHQKESNQTEQYYNKKNPVEPQNTLTMKLTDIIKRLRLRKAARNLINSTRSRMFKNMKPHQYAFINDKAQDFSDTKKLQKSDYFLLNSKLQKGMLINRSVQILLKILKLIPVINPSSGWKYIWDILVCIVLLYSFFVIPTMVSFGLNEEVISHGNILDFLLIVNFFDIFITCNTGFYKRGVFCKNRGSIWRKYYYEQLRTDLFSLTPILIFRLLSLNLQKQEYYLFITLSILIKWKAITKLYNNTQQKYILLPNTRNILSLMNLFFKILLIAHGCACLWIYSGRLSQDYYEQNWFKYKKIEDHPWDNQYLYAFYFCIVTMTTVGYGDIVPQSPVEILVCIVILLFACGVFGFSVNTIQTILQNFSKSETEILDKMFIIKNYLSKKSINANLSKDVTEYLEYFWRANKTDYAEEEEKMIKLLPDSLRNDLLIESNHLILRECQIFQNNFSEDVIKATISIIQEKNYTPDEVIYTETDGAYDNSLFFIQEGVVEIYIDITNEFSSNIGMNQRQYKTIKRLKKGDYFGEIEFFTDGSRTMNVRSLHFSTLLKIERKDFIEKIQKFPLDYEQFCFIKDRLIMQHDYSKINHKCLSCKSEGHVLEFCPYLHYNANKPKLIALINQTRPQARNELPKSEQHMRVRQRYRLLPKQVAEIANALLQFQEDLIEDYCQKYLSYDISKCDICTNILNIYSNVQMGGNIQNENKNDNNNNCQNDNICDQKSKITDIQLQNILQIMNQNQVIGNNLIPNKNTSNQQSFTRKVSGNNIMMQNLRNQNRQNTNEDDYQQKANFYKKNYVKKFSKGVSLQEEVENPDSFSPRAGASKLQPYNNSNQQRLSRKNIDIESNQSVLVSLPNQISASNLTNLNNQIGLDIDQIDKISQLNNNKNFSQSTSIQNTQTNNCIQQHNFTSMRQESLNKIKKQFSFIETLPELMNIYNQQNSDQNFHIKRLFFDIFYGQFEKMHFFELYYPLNNYVPVIKQLVMSVEQKKQMKVKLLEQQKNNINKILLKKKKKNGPRCSVNQNTVDHQAIKRLVDKFEQEGREVKSMKESKIGSAQQVTNANIYINNPSFQANILNLSPSQTKQLKRDSTMTILQSFNRVGKNHNTFFKSNYQESEDDDKTAKRDISTQFKQNGQQIKLTSKSPSASIANFVISSQLQSYDDGTNKSNTFQGVLKNIDESQVNDNKMSLVTSLNSQNKQIQTTSIQTSKKNITSELEKFIAIESRLSSPQKEKAILNYEHSEIPDINFNQYNNSFLDDFSKE